MELQNFGNLGIMAIASVLGTFEMFGAINPEEMMMMLTDTITKATLEPNIGKFCEVCKHPPHGECQ